MHLRVLYEDSDVIAIDKASGMLSIPDRFDEHAPNLAAMLKERCGEIFVCHRLDRDTSGVIVFAKHADAHRVLNEQFESHTIRKQYEAIVDGTMTQSAGTIELAIGPHRRHRGMMMVDAVHGKLAVTHYHVKTGFREFSHLAIDLETGRQHQIRVHCAAIGHPLMVDPLYGTRTEFLLSSIKKNYRGAEHERPLMDRLTLHASELEFVHPGTNEGVIIRSPLPKDMAATLRQLARWNPA
jgi:RluA family pseudouridine synthase